jgi:hypothetical protein
LAILLSPNLVYARFAEAPDRTVLYVLGYGTFAAAALCTLWAMWRSGATPQRSDGGPGFHLAYVPVFTALYLSTFVVLWAVALPAYLDATGGTTSSGTPVGSLPYAVVSAAACVWFVMPYRRIRPGSLHGAPTFIDDRNSLRTGDSFVDSTPTITIGIIKSNLVYLGVDCRRWTW